ncbi:MAG: choice-of-anchor Q domain-containing protein [Candidatus Paceibacterota bacterium]
MAQSVKTSYGSVLLLSCLVLAATLISQAWSELERVWNELERVSVIVTVQVPKQRQLAQVSPGNPDASVYYVDSSRISNGDGSEANPWKNWGNIDWNAIQSSLGSRSVSIYLSSRDVWSSSSSYVVVATGNSNYWLTIDGNSKYNLTDSGDAVWTNEDNPNNKARLTQTGGSGLLIDNDHSYIKIKGLYLDKMQWGGINLGTSMPTRNVHHITLENNVIDTPQHNHGIWFGYAEEGCHDIVIRNNVVKNTLLESIYLGHYNYMPQTITGVIVEGNTIIDGGLEGEGDIDIKPGVYGAIIRNNTHYDTGAHSGGSCGVAVYGDNAQVYGNRFYGLDTTASGWGHGILITSAGDAQGNTRAITSALVYNNLLYGNAAGIRVDGARDNISGLKIWNNTIFGNAHGVYSTASAPYNIEMDMRNNIIYSNSVKNITTARVNFSSNTNNLETDPFFVNGSVSNGDFRLQQSSPAIASGLNLSSSFSTDFSGASRPSSGPWSIGAYEYGSAPPSGSNPTPVPNATPTPSSNLSTIRVTTTGSSGLVKGSSINCQTGSTIACSGVFANGTLVTLAANPDPGSSFTAWGGACSSSSTWCTLTINGDVSVTATFGSTPPTPTPIPNATPTPDVTAPTLSAIQANPTSSGVNITFVSSEPSSTQIEYGLTTAYGNTTALNSTLTTSHTQTIYNLTPNTTYHYRVISKDFSSNTATSPDLTFITPDPSTATPVPTPMSYATPTPRPYTPSPTTAVRVTSNLPSKVLPGTTLNHPLSSSAPIPQLDSDIEISVPQIPSWFDVISSFIKEVYLDVIYGMTVTGEWLTGR